MHKLTLIRLLPKLTAEALIPPKYSPVSSHAFHAYFLGRYMEKRMGSPIEIIVKSKDIVPTR